MTKYEKEIYKLVTQSTQHLTVEQVFLELKKCYPAVALATIYNNLNKLCEAGVEMEFKNISASLADLKAYLALRESSPVFDGPKANGSLGVPCFVLEDGTLTLDLKRVLA